MPDTYHMTSTSNHSANINDDDVVLSVTSDDSRRLIVRTLVVDNRDNPDAGVKVTLIHQHKRRDMAWEDVETDTLTTVKADEQVKLILDSKQTSNLYKHLTNLYKISDTGGVRPGDTTLVVGREGEIIKTDSGRASIINSLLSQGHGEDVWKSLEEKEPGLATKLSYARIHGERQKALGKFESNLEQELDEPTWHDFFKKNTWIFGYGLNYQILKPIQSQPYVGGQNLEGRGGQNPDFLARTEATVKFTVWVEIKKPTTALFGGNEPYRSGVWRLGNDLVGGVSQLQVNCHKWETEGSRTEENQELLTDIYTIQPKGILVIGHLRQLGRQTDKRNTFELYRRNILNPEIITFDELYDRAKFIVENPPMDGSASNKLR